MKKLISVLLALTLALTLMPAAFADHVHDQSCGYVPPSPCTHEHDGCYEPPYPGVPCDKGCPDGVHSEDCSYEPSNPGLPCPHVHDGSCGYSAGSPCTYVEPHYCNFVYSPAGEGKHNGVCLTDPSHTVSEACYSDNNSNHLCDHCAQPMSDHEFSYEYAGDDHHKMICYCGLELDEACTFGTAPEGTEGVLVCICGNERQADPQSGSTTTQDDPHSDRPLDLMIDHYTVIDVPVSNGTASASWSREELDARPELSQGMQINTPHLTALIDGNIVATAQTGIDFNYKENDQGFSFGVSDGDVPIADLMVSYGTQKDFSDRVFIWSPGGFDSEAEIPEHFIILEAYVEPPEELSPEEMAHTEELLKAIAAEDEAREAVGVANASLFAAKNTLTSLQELANSKAEALDAYNKAQAQYDAFLQAAAQMTDQAKDNNVHRAREEWLRMTLEGAKEAYDAAVRAEESIPEQEELVEKLTEKLRLAEEELEDAVIRHKIALLNFENIGAGYAHSREYIIYPHSSPADLEVYPVSTLSFLF